MTAGKNQITKNPTTGAQPKTTTAGAIVEKLEAWILTQQISVDEKTKFNALIDSLKSSNRLQIVKCFIEYLKSATIYRSIWIQQIAGLMNKVDQRVAARSFEDPRRDVIADADRWFEHQHITYQTKFDAAVDRWIQEQVKEGLLQSLRSIRSENAAYISKGLVDLPGELMYLMIAIEQGNALRNEDRRIKVPRSVASLVKIIRSGRCTIAGLGSPTQQLMAWPITKHFFDELLAFKDASIYLYEEHGVTQRETTLCNRYEAEWPGIRAKDHGKFKRENLDKLFRKGALEYGYKKTEP